MSGIHAELPACRALAEALPAISPAGLTYGFNFLRLSLVCQSADPAFHLDSDAATALPGDAGTLNEREVLRLLLNLSSQEERSCITSMWISVPPILSWTGRTSASRIPSRPTSPTEGVALANSENRLRSPVWVFGGVAPADSRAVRAA